MSTVLAMFTDGREHVFDRDRRESWGRWVGDCYRRVIFDDSGDPAFRDRLREAFTEWHIVSWPQRLGFGGTIASGWEWILANTQASHVAHLEDDFMLRVGVDLDGLVGILNRHPYLAQVALLRQPVNTDEAAAGTVLYPSSVDQADEYAVWTENRECFTTNPCVYRRSLLELGWPRGEESEGVFTHRLLAEGTPEASAEHVRFGYYGARAWAPLVEHVGTLRIGEGY